MIMDDKKKLVEKQLNQISSNFELDILRLIKTQSFISLSKDVIDSEVESLKDRSNSFQSKLKNFSIKLLELENELSSTGLPDGDNFNRFTSHLKETLRENREYSDYLEKELSSNLASDIQKLESLQRFYVLEMEAFEKELDNRIRFFQKSITELAGDNSFSDAVPEPHVTKTVYKSYGENPISEGSDNSEIIDDTTIEFGDVEELSEAKIVADEIISNSEAESEKKSGNTTAYLFFTITLIILLVFVYLNPKEFNNQRDLINDKIKHSISVIKSRFASDESAVVTEKSNIINKVEINNNVPKSAEKKNTIEDNVIADDKESAISHTSSSRSGNPVLSDIEFKEGKVYSVKSDFANVRQGPSIYYDVVIRLKTDEQLTALGEYKGHWLKIKTKDGKEGWISGKLVKKVK